MDYIPIKIENSSDSGLASGQKVRSGEKGGEQFGSFLSEFLQSKDETRATKKHTTVPKTREGRESAQHTESVATPEKRSPEDQQRATITRTEELDSGQRISISKKDLTEADQKKIESLLAKILSFLQGNPKGQQLLKDWINGKIQLLVPVSIQNGDTQQAGNGFLLIQPDPDSKGTSNSSSPFAFNFQLLLSQLAADLDTRASEPLKEMAGAFQIRNGQIHLKSLGTGNGKIPLILFADGKTTAKGELLREGSDSTQSNQNLADFIKAGRMAAHQRGVTGVRSPGQPNTSSAKILLIASNQGASAENAVNVIGQGQLLGKELSGEIAGLLESLKGKMKVKMAGKGNTAQGAAKFPARIGSQTANQVNMTQAREKIASTIQPARNSHQANLMDSANAQKALKQFTEEFIRFDHNQMTDGQSVMFSQLVQQPVSEVLANGQPKTPMFQVIQKIEAMVQAAKAQRTLNQPQALKASLVLHPKHLGSVHLNLQFHDDTLSGTILAASKEVKALIEHSLPALKHALHNQHTGVNHLEVEVRSDLSQENGQNWFLQEQAGKQKRDRDTWAEYQPEDGAMAGPLSDPAIVPPAQTRTPDYSGNGRLELYA